MSTLHAKSILPMILVSHWSYFPHGYEANSPFQKKRMQDCRQFGATHLTNGIGTWQNMEYRLATMNCTKINAKLDKNI